MLDMMLLNRLFSYCNWVLIQLVGVKAFQLLLLFGALPGLKSLTRRFAWGKFVTMVRRLPIKITTKKGSVKHFSPFDHVCGINFSRDKPFVPDEVQMLAALAGFATRIDGNLWQAGKMAYCDGVIHLGDKDNS